MPNLAIDSFRQPYVSGQITSVLTQSVVIFSMVGAVLFLKTRYTYWQMWSATVILGATIICLMGNGLSGGISNWGWAVLTFWSPLPQAWSMSLKEYVFKKRPLDIFVMCTFGSIFLVVLWPIYTPLVLAFNQTGDLTMGQYLKDGWQCFIGKYQFPPGSPYDCSLMPWIFFLYMAINLAFNISLLFLLKRASALQSFMAMQAVLPLSFLLYYFDWPLIGSSPINAYIIAALFLVVFGLVFYRVASYSQKARIDDSRFSGCFAVQLSLTKTSDQPLQLNAT